jgi:hypothetical protein
VAVFALVCLHPLFFQNVARVANDAIAVATRVAGISLLVLADGRLEQADQPHIDSHADSGTAVDRLDARCIRRTAVAGDEPGVGSVSRPLGTGWLELSADPRDAQGSHGWYWGVLLAVALTGAVVATLRRHRSVEGAGGLGVCAVVVVSTALGVIYYAVLSHAVFGRSMANPWYFMTALPFLFVLLVRGLEAIDRRLATAGAAALVVLFVAIELHGTWVQMPRFYASTTDTALQWSRLTMIHPAFLSGDLRWLFLAAQLGALCLVVGALVLASRHRAYAS